MRRTLLLLLWSSLLAVPATGQSLSPGDLALVGMNADNPDAFAFVALADLPGGAVIHFTDNGWQAAGTFRDNEGTLSYTVPGGGHAAGTVVSIEDPGTDPMAFSASGDQILAYQGTSASPSFVYAMNNEGSGWQADATSSNTSALPTGLTDGTTAVAVDETDNIVYAGTTTGTCDDLLAAIGNPANWSGSNAARQAMPSGPFTVTASCSGGGGGGTAPADPSALSAAAQGSAQIDLAWTDNSSDETGFQVERASGGSSFALVATVGADAASYSDTGLAASTAYTYRVRAYNGAGFSGYTNTASATTDAGSGGGGGSAEVRLARAWDLVYETQGTPAGTYYVTVQVVTADATADTDFTLSATGGSADAGSDLTGFTSPTTVTVPAGSTAPQTVTVTVTDDADDSEAVEDLIFTLSAASGKALAGSVASPSEMRLWILDDLVPETTLFDGQTGSTLRSSLVSAYGGAPTLGYDTARDTLYGVVDRETNGDVCGLYSGWCITLPDGQDPSSYLYQGGSADGINAEHTWPQSKGAGTEPQRSDMHILFPARTAVNSSRSNAPFGEIPDTDTDTWYVSNTSQTSVPASNVDAYSEKDNDDNPDPSYSDRFEPREGVRGDVARAMFYFYTMYESAATGADANFFDAQKVDLYLWHGGDGVSAAEARRNVEVASYQGGTLNPFILDPTLVDRAYNTDGNLPVELTRFEAVADAGDVLLTWETASETGNAGFEVQQRVAGTWDVLAFVEGRGTTAEPQRYTYRAPEAGVGRQVFRLRQVDFDGTFAYSPEVEVYLEAPVAYVVSAPYPNPLRDRMRLTVTVDQAQEVEVAVYDVLGRRVAVLHEGMLRGDREHTLTWTAAHLPSGTYLVRVRGARFVESQAVTLVR